MPGLGKLHLRAFFPTLNFKGCYLAVEVEIHIGKEEIHMSFLLLTTTISDFLIQKSI
jgi:hypothetical protein